MTNDLLALFLIMSSFSFIPSHFFLALSKFIKITIIYSIKLDSLDTPCHILIAYLFDIVDYVFFNNLS